MLTLNVTTDCKFVIILLPLYAKLCLIVFSLIEMIVYIFIWLVLLLYLFPICLLCVVEISCVNYARKSMRFFFSHQWTPIVLTFALVVIEWMRISVFFFFSWISLVICVSVNVRGRFLFITHCGQTDPMWTPADRSGNVFTTLVVSRASLSLLQKRLDGTWFLIWKCQFVFCAVGWFRHMFVEVTHPSSHSTECNLNCDVMMMISLPCIQLQQHSTQPPLSCLMTLSTPIWIGGDCVSLFRRKEGSSVILECTYKVGVGLLSFQPRLNAANHLTLGWVGNHGWSDRVMAWHDTPIGESDLGWLADWLTYGGGCFCWTLQE